MTWKPDDRYRKQIGDFEMVPEHDRKSTGTAHLVTFPDGRQIRVLPDGDSSGQKRSRVVERALTALHTGQVNSGMRLLAATDEHGKHLFDPVAYVVGALTVEIDYPAFEQVYSDCQHPAFILAKATPVDGGYEVTIECENCGRLWSAADIAEPVAS